MSIKHWEQYREERNDSIEGAMLREIEDSRSRLKELKDFIANDGIAMTYQTFGQYRSAILKLLGR